MRLIVAVLLCWMPLWGWQYDRLLLQAEISVFPKLLLLSKNPGRLLVGDRILFVIAHAPEDRAVAEELKAGMLADGARLEPYPLDVRLVPFDAIGNVEACSAVFALHAPREKGYRDSVRTAVLHGVPSFIYDVAYLGEGFLFSLNIEREAVIYFNASEQMRYGITFSPALYQIVRYYDENSSEPLSLY